MHQLLQNLKNGDVIIADIPEPRIKPGYLLIRSTRSLVSIGTEKMLVDFGRSGFIAKAKKQPDKVKQVIQKAKTDGILPAIQAVLNKLDTPLPLGYSNVGVVMQVGGDVSGFKIGDRVVSNGPHAQVISIPQNLAAKIPDGVSDEHATFTVVGAIGLQGVRLLNPQLGETVVVMGLGLIGLLTAQILLANGCRVIGLDFDKKKLKIAENFGMDVIDLSQQSDPSISVMVLTHGVGVDGVVITASTTSSDPLHHAAQMCRIRGRVILVGVIGNEWSRDDFYKKEISFQVSCSYGPGRYDPLYEEKGSDYPIGYVRWTVKRNFEAILALFNSKKINVEEFINLRIALSDAEAAYHSILENKSLIGVVIQYPEKESEKKISTSHAERKGHPSPSKTMPKVAFLGAGNFTKAILLPAVKRMAPFLSTIVSEGGVSAWHLSEKYQFKKAATHIDEILDDDEVNTVFITTRHGHHAAQVIKCLDAGKHIFVEKPLCLTRGELLAIENCYRNKPELKLMVGFNRRFSPYIQKIKSILSTSSSPKSFNMLVNAGAIASSHWTQDPNEGGGRILGEAVHFIDLLRYLAGNTIVTVSAVKLGENRTEDIATIQLSFSDGSIGTIQYWANGSASFPKERLTVFWGHSVLELNNFRVLKGYGVKGFSSYKTFAQQKGHREEVEAFLTSIELGQPTPIPFFEAVEVTKASFLALESMRVQGQVLPVSGFD